MFISFFVFIFLFICIFDEIQDIENLKAQSKGQGDYDLTRAFQDLKKSKQIEQEMEKQLQDAQGRTRTREQVRNKKDYYTIYFVLIIHFFRCC